LASAVFAMVQIGIESGQPDQAVQWLEKPKIGPLALVKDAKGTVANKAFAIETYKLALRAYVSVHPTQLKKAEEAMAALDKLIEKGGDAQAADSLTAVYISLSRELEHQLQELRKSGKKKELAEVSQAFEDFLERATQRADPKNYAALNWVAATYFSLGNSADQFSANGKSPAKIYFEKAAAAYDRMLQMADKDPARKAQCESLRMRLAECYRRGENFDEAIHVILGVVRQRPTLVTAQIEAAEIYQARGVVDPKGYYLAMFGGEPGRDGKNSIWGWAKLSQMSANNWPKFASTFYESRLHMAESRYRFALTEKDTKRSKPILEAAKQDLWSTFTRHADLGGEDNLGRCDQLLKLIQKSLGEQQIGLEEFKVREEAAATKSASQ
jgi:tetratricopeptide (TPR) repeat protein